MILLTLSDSASEKEFQQTVEYKDKALTAIATLEVKLKRRIRSDDKRFFFTKYFM